jgi:CRP-like cAMP-binding protein
MVGARTIIGLPAARTLVAYSGLVSFLYGADTVLFVGVSEHRLGTGPQGFGYLLAGLGVGGVLGAGLVNQAAGSRRLGVIIVAGALGYSLPTALLAVIHAPAMAFLVQVFRGGATLVVDVLAITALQRAVARDQLARVFGVFWAFVLAAITLGTVITPVVVRLLGLNGGLFVMALAPAALAIAGYPALRAIDRETARRALELEPKVALLEQLEIFAKARRPILERLAAASTAVRFAPTQTIIRSGDVADALYVLADGEVEVTTHSDGAPHTLAQLAAPNYFGEIGVLEGIPRTATVTALTDCCCEQIDGETLQEALVTSPPSSSLMETARGRLAVTQPARTMTFGSTDPLAEEPAPAG